MMAACMSAKGGAEVLLLEKNNILGKKLLITGKGRCNITNFCGEDEFIANMPENGRFLYSAINFFTAKDTISFFEQAGVMTKTERGKRVFPISDKSQDVVNALHRVMMSKNCHIRTGVAVKKLIIQNSKCVGCFASSGEIFKADKIIVCCGGKSYPQTGSSGDGYNLALQGGHTVTPLSPSLVPLVSCDTCCKSLQGLSLKNISLKVFDTKTKKEPYNDFGELIFTHFGISGPLVLSASAHMSHMADGRYIVVIDLKPALTDGQLSKRLLRDLSKNINKSIANSLKELLPKRIIPIILTRADIDFNKQCNSITKEDRAKLINNIKNFNIEIKGFRPIEEAIVTSGGVSVNEINPKTMESKITKQLFFAGEVIDVSGYTGGFNLQAAWSTGALAGKVCT